MLSEHSTTELQTHFSMQTKILGAYRILGKTVMVQDGWTLHVLRRMGPRVCSSRLSKFTTHLSIPTTPLVTAVTSFGALRLLHGSKPIMLENCTRQRPLLLYTGGTPSRHPVLHLSTEVDYTAESSAASRVVAGGLLLPLSCEAPSNFYRVALAVVAGEST